MTRIAFRNSTPTKKGLPKRRFLQAKKSRCKPIPAARRGSTERTPLAYPIHDSTRFVQYSGLWAEQDGRSNRDEPISGGHPTVRCRRHSRDPLRDQRLLPRLIDYVNADGMRYDYLLGPRLGRTSSKEQYAYVYDTDRILGDPNASYTVNDGHPDLEASKKSEPTVHPISFIANP